MGSCSATRSFHFVTSALAIFFTSSSGTLRSLDTVRPMPHEVKASTSTSMRPSILSIFTISGHCSPSTILGRTWSAAATRSSTLAQAEFTVSSGFFGRGFFAGGGDGSASAFFFFGGALDAAPLPALVILPTTIFFSGLAAEADARGARSFFSEGGFTFFAGGSPVRNSG